MYIEERNYQINRIALKVLGLWPSKLSAFVLMQRVLFTVTLLTYAIAQLLVFVTTEYDSNLIFRIFSIIFPIIYIIMQYYMFIIKADNVKQMLEQIQDDYSSLNNKMEIDIINHYDRNMWFFSVFTITFAIFAIIVCAAFQHLPIILDAILPLNESRPRRLIVIVEYFVNQEKYFYPMLMHEILSGSILTITLVCTGITILMFIQHSCVLFKITRYRIENVIEENAETIPNSNRAYYFYGRILHAISIHRRAIEFFDIITSNFLKSFTFLLLIGVSSLCLNLLRIITLTKNIGDAFITGTIIILHLIYMFILNYGGQKITDNGIKLFQASYNALWYVAPLQTQKLLFFIMQKGTKNVTLICGGLYVASLEGFATLLSTAISYLTVIYSTR